MIAAELVGLDSAILSRFDDLVIWYYCSAVKSEMGEQDGRKKARSTQSTCDIRTK